MSDNREILIEWLRDAYAMEQTAIEILEKQEQRIKNYPQMLEKVSEHRAQSQQQAEMVKGCLERLGTDTSATKTGIGKMAGVMAGLANVPAEDEVIKDALADLAFENFEIASYRSLIGAAEALGDQETKRVCTEILRQEEAMAQWVSDHLPGLTQDFLQKNELDLEAKR